MEIVRRRNVLAPFKAIFNPFTKKPQYIQEGGDVGGKYGFNYETLTGDKTLIPNVDYIYQYLHPNSVDRIIILDKTNAKVGDRFIIINREVAQMTSYLEVKQDTTSLDKIYARGIKEWIFSGATYGWVAVNNATGVEDNYWGLSMGKNANATECSISLGHNSDGHLDGIAIGTGAMGYSYGVAVGYNALGYTKGVAIGENAEGHDQGIAIGRNTDTNLKMYSIALGYRSKNRRQAELAINIGDEIEEDMRDQLQQIVIGSWVRKTTDATPITMQCAGQAGGEFALRPQSALVFKIMVTARDNTTGDCAGYLFDGLIKRDGSNNVILCASNITVLHEDDATWDCSIDVGSYAPQITITGDDTNLVRWAARLDGVETSFTAA